LRGRKIKKCGEGLIFENNSRGHVAGNYAKIRLKIPGGKAGAPGEGKKRVENR